jgi:hypothetical protein
MKAFTLMDVFICDASPWTALEGKIKILLFSTVGDTAGA